MIQLIEHKLQPRLATSATWSFLLGLFNSVLHIAGDRRICSTLCGSVLRSRWTSSTTQLLILYICIVIFVTKGWYAILSCLRIQCQQSVLRIARVAAAKTSGEAARAVSQCLSPRLLAALGFVILPRFLNALNLPKTTKLRRLALILIFIPCHIKCSQSVNRGSHCTFEGIKDL